MDKKNLTIGVLLMMAAFASLILSSRLAPPQTEDVPSIGSGPSTSPFPTDPNTAPSPSSRDVPASSPSDATFAALATSNDAAVITVLGNDYIEARLTNFGGAVLDVAILKYPTTRGGDEPYLFNAQHADPMLAFTADSFPGLDKSVAYQLVSATSSEVVYRAVFENRIEVTRRYRLPSREEDPYRLRHETTFRNLTDLTTPLPRASLSLGTTALVSANDFGQYLNVMAYDGKKTFYTDRKDLDGGGFLSWIGLRDGSPKSFIETQQRVAWASIKNQFFASVYTPSEAAVGIITRRVDLPPLPGVTRANQGITGAIRIDLPALAPHASVTTSGLFYVGPKEYTRLARFDQDEDRVMQFDRYFFNRILGSGYLAPFMNWLMNITFNWVGNWGFAIVLMTILLKIVTLPFTLAASKSAKRMQKLQPEMKTLREKFKDNPQKMNQATLALFKTHRVNPAGGCIPVLITIPLFVAFFAMLMGTAELRFQSFLWTKDLSAPDTVFRLFGLPLNIWPLLMGATMVIQMRLTPQPSIDSTQAKIFKFMPWVFTLICYNFSAGLALYSTVNGLFTIGQQMMVNKYSKDEPLAPVTPAAKSGKPTRSGKPVKNVTPRKKK